ncbi:putative protein arginine N-methyltransferase 6 [Sesamum angolense]|uniref:Protein arginine N-methyltransferase domain-containing protein n=1 Tax=Sesamum angolense TaxID=2727404 RepID=A0AAE1WV66_9LAMI|nr:putative protein arginine N-methyltransferase 6 [Sesamum angolense]
MFLQTSGGNGSGGSSGGGGGNGNGNSHGGVIGGSHLTKQRLRRRSRSRSRDPDGGGSSSNTRVSQQQQQQEKERATHPCTDFDVAYFNSYAHLGIHEEMIKDQVRTQTYRNAIFRNRDRIAGKVVVDVGCGTGILSIFCAQAGARRVYAVDASDIAIQANEVVKANNLSDKIIVLHGRVEDVEIDDKVDVIVSEWMGYMLLYESMLGSVITARDRWLKPGGLILPSFATDMVLIILLLALAFGCHRLVDIMMSFVQSAVVHGTYLIQTGTKKALIFWRNVYGIDMSAVMPLAKQCAFEEPSVETISGENVLTWPHVVKYVDCFTVTIEELESVSTTFKFRSMMRAPFHGFAFWFDVEFSAPALFSFSNNPQAAYFGTLDNVTDTSQRKKRANPSEALVLSTAPEDPPTHWQQQLGPINRPATDPIATFGKSQLISFTWLTLIYFYDPIDVEQDQLIEGSVTLSQSKENPRFMNIQLEYAQLQNVNSFDRLPSMHVPGLGNAL